MFYIYKCNKCEKEKEVSHSIKDEPEVICECGEKMSDISNCGIYMLTNLINNKIYIGQTRDIKRRNRDYKKNNPSNAELKEDISNYGFVNFKFEVLEYCEEMFLNNLEKKYIKEFDAINKGYNKKNGGCGGGRHSEKSKKLMSQNGKGKHPWNKENSEKMSKLFSGKGNPFYGKHHSIETIKKIKENIKRKFGIENHAAKPIFCETTQEKFEYASLASNKYDLDLSSIIKCCKGKRKHVKGFCFKYLEE